MEIVRDDAREEPPELVALPHALYASYARDAYAHIRARAEVGASLCVTFRIRLDLVLVREELGEGVVRAGGAGSEEQVAVGPW